MFIEVIFTLVGLFFWSFLLSYLWTTIVLRILDKTKGFVVLSVISLIFLLVGFVYPQHKEVFYNLSNKTTVSHVNNSIVIEQNCYREEYMARGALFILQDVLSGNVGRDCVVKHKVSLDKCL